MKLTINRTIFLNELSTVQRAISSKTTIPILTGVKLSLSNDGLSLTGSNADISIETFLNNANSKAEMLIERTGSVVLPSRFFGEIIRKLPESVFTLEVLPSNEAIITSGAARFTINGLSADNYPHLPVVDENNQLKIPVRVLNKMIAETGFAVSMQESRPILTGVHFVLKDANLLAVATDSHRLSQRNIPMESGAEGFDIVVPGKSLLELSRSFKDEEEIVEISIMENQVLFKTKTMYFYSRLLEGKYPDTDRLIPSNFGTEIQFSVPKLLAAIERASLLSHEGRNNIVKLSIDSNKAIISGNSPEIGNVKEELTFLSLNGEALEISFNPDYMKDALKAFGGIDVIVKFISPVRPFTLEPVDNSISFVQLITPVRTT